MKTFEDEAFDELARRQGAWGGGFKAKQAMAADKLKEPEREALKLALKALESMKETLSEHDEPTTFNEDQAIAAIKAALAQPAQEPVECLDCGSHNVGIPATYDSLINSVKALNT